MNPNTTATTNTGTTNTGTNAKNGMKGENKGGWGDIVLFPFSATAKILAWLMNPKAGAKYVMYGAALYSYCVSAESLYVAIPDPDRPAIERRFIPKFGVNDGAELSRLVSVGLMKNIKGAVNAILQMQLKMPQEEWTVWGDPNFYLAIFIATTIGALEAMAIRSVSIDVKKKMAKTANSHKKMDIDPQSIAMGKVRTVEYNMSGLNQYAIRGLGILLTYCIETAGFLASNEATGGVAFVYFMISVFGFEVFWSLAQSPEGEL